MLRVSKDYFCLLLALAVLGNYGCASQGDIPGDATLVWSGEFRHPEGMNDLTPNGSAGQVYIYDDTIKQLTAVRPARPGSLDFDWVVGHKYRVYFKPFED
jgi:hypothetical protein